MNSSDVYSEEKPPPTSPIGPFICGVVMLVLCILGLFANLFSLFIFTRRAMRSSINVFLAGLSAIDGAVLLFAIPTFVIPTIIEIEGLEVISLFCLYQISMMAQTCSVWTFVLISLERYLAVVHPFKVQRCLTIKRARIAQLSVVAASIIYNLIRFWEYKLELGPKGEPFQRRLRDSHLYFTVYYTTLYLISHFLGPFLLIAILNVFILLAIRRAQDQRTKLTYRQTQQRKTTQMIIVVTAVFAICNSLPFILNLVEAMRPTLFDANDELQPSAFLILDISNVLVVLNSSSTICIYLIYCRKYRVLWIFYVGRYICRLSPQAIDRFRRTPSFERSQQAKLSSNSFAGGAGHACVGISSSGGGHTSQMLVREISHLREKASTTISDDGGAADETAPINKAAINGSKRRRFNRSSVSNASCRMSIRSSERHPQHDGRRRCTITTTLCPASAVMNDMSICDV